MSRSPLVGFGVLVSSQLCSANGSTTAYPITGPFTVSTRTGHAIAEQPAFFDPFPGVTQRSAAVADGNGGWKVAYGP